MSSEVQSMFAEIAPKYDRANRILSLGIDARWRRRAVRLSGAMPGDRVLDVACGTGESSFAFQRRVGSPAVVGADFCEPMLVEARRKAERKGMATRFQWADAMELPFTNDAFDICSIAFGIRNIDQPVQALREMARVTRPGGRVVVLEFGQPTGLWGRTYRWYGRNVIPRIGGLVTGHRAPYEYLPRTAAAFPAGDAFLGLMRASGGYTKCTAHSLTGGIAYAYVGIVS